MRMPTKATTRLNLFALLVGASMMTACSNGGFTGPQDSGSTLKPNGRSESGYVVAERDSLDAITRTAGGTIETFVDTTLTTISPLPKKKQR